jgi:hypothetical protein
MRQKAGAHPDPHCPVMVTPKYPQVPTTSTTKKQGTTVLNAIPGALKPVSSQTPLWKTVTLLRD